MVIDGAGFLRAWVHSRWVSVTRPSGALEVIIFTDSKGISRLPKCVVPPFWSKVMERCACILARRREHSPCVNS